MPAGVTGVAEKQCFFVEGTVADLAMCVFKEGGEGVSEGDGAKGAEGEWDWRKWAWSCREKWEQGGVVCKAHALTCCFWRRGGVDPSIMPSCWEVV